MSIKTVSIAALISVAAVGAAFANPAKEQIAAVLNVDANAFTLAQLVQLEEAARDNDQQAAAFIAAQAAGTIGATDGASAGNVQRAATLGVEAGKFTAAELTLLERARKDGDSIAWDFVASGANRATDGSSNNAGVAQLAASLGVNAADHSFAELASIAGDRE